MKKRKGLWVAGALVVVVALSAAITFIVDYNSTDARIERAVAQIVEEYGFEFKHRSHVNHQPPYTYSVFIRAPIDADSADEIAASLRAACPSFEYKHEVHNEAHQLVTTSGGDPWRERHTFKPGEEDGSRIRSISLVSQERARTNPDIDPLAYLVLRKYDRPSLWQRIKEFWPW